MEQLRGKLAVLTAAMTLSFSSQALAQADFAVVWSSQPNASLAIGDTVSISYDVENVGFSSASFSVGFIIDDGVQGYLLYEDQITSLAAGGFTSRTMTFAVPAGTEGTWLAGLVADPYQLITENDENNNVFVFTSMLTIGGGGSSGGTIFVSNDPLPAATVGTPYSATLYQSGGTAPTWYVSSGQMPPGLTLSTSGGISGTPSAAGQYTFNVTAEQSGYTPGSGSFTINVSGGGNRLTVTPTSIPQANAGTPYEVQFQASGGVPPYGYQLIGAPQWLTMVGTGNEAGTMRGMPDVIGSHTLTVYVLDSAGADATVMVTLDVVGIVNLSINGTHPGAFLNQQYTATLVSGGVAPYTARISNGNPPPGLALDGATARLSGVPTQQGNFTFTVDVTDSAGTAANGQVQIAVTELVGLQVAATEITLFANADVNHKLEAKGGTEPYTWQMLGGTLPGGVSFDGTTGSLVGKPMRVGDGTASFRVTDAAGASAMADIKVIVKVYRPGGGSGGGSSRDGGCTCVALPAGTGASSAALLIIAAGLVVIARRRRR